MAPDCIQRNHMVYTYAISKESTSPAAAEPRASILVAMCGQAQANLEWCTARNGKVQVFLLSLVGCSWCFMLAKKRKNTPKVSHGSPENQPLESMIFRTWKPRYTLGCVLPSPRVIWAVIVCVVGPCYYLSIHHDIYYIWYVTYRYNNFDIHFKSEL